MNCKNCRIEISKEMKFCIKNNVCPACGESIMDPEKILQLKKLRKIFKQYALTGDDKLDSLISEKVVEIVCEHLDFTIISESLMSTSITPEVVEEIEVVETTDVVVPSKKSKETGKGSGSAIKRSNDGKTLKNTKQSPGAGNMYTQAANEQYGDELEAGDLGTEGSSNEDFSEFFNVAKGMDSETQAKINSLKQKAKTQVGNGKGITRVK